jgi:hypothetical protein
MSLLDITFKDNSWSIWIHCLTYEKPLEVMKIEADDCEYWIDLSLRDYPATTARGTVHVPLSIDQARKLAQDILAITDAPKAQPIETIADIKAQTAAIREVREFIEDNPIQ